MPPSRHGLRRATDVQAMLSPHRIEENIIRQNLCAELLVPGIMNA
jgi:hypothetical protein